MDAYSLAVLIWIFAGAERVEHRLREAFAVDHSSSTLNPVENCAARHKQGIYRLDNWATRPRRPRQRSFGFPRWEGFKSNII